MLLIFWVGPNTFIATTVMCMISPVSRYRRRQEDCVRTNGREKTATSWC